MRNIFAKLPRLMQGKMKLLVQQVFLALTYAAALKRERDLIAKFTDRYPTAIEGLERDLEECVTYLRFPEAHYQRIQTTNRLEQLNGEGRRHTKNRPRRGAHQHPTRPIRPPRRDPRPRSALERIGTVDRGARARRPHKQHTPIRELQEPPTGPARHPFRQISFHRHLRADR